MNVANLELCKELYELSGWTETHHVWHDDSLTPLVCGYDDVKHALNFTPAYSLGYLLRKLPDQTRLTKGVRAWSALYSNDYTRMPDEEAVKTQGKADTPEDAACKLCIELFKQGILKRDVQPNN